MLSLRFSYHCLHDIVLVFKCPPAAKCCLFFDFSSFVYDSGSLFFLVILIRTRKLHFLFRLKSMTDPSRNMLNSDVKSGASRQTPKTLSNATATGHYSLPTPTSSFAVELKGDGHRLTDSTLEQQKPPDVVVEQPEKGKYKRIASTSEPRSAVTDNRLLHPQLALQRKRSRISPASILPALETTQLNPLFNIFTALLENNDLLLEVSSRLDIKSLIDLYAMSKDYHYLLNSHYTTYVKNYSLKRCPRVCCHLQVDVLQIALHCRSMPPTSVIAIGSPSRYSLPPLAPNGLIPRACCQ
jgi:hypothetical protein